MIHDGGAMCLIDQLTGSVFSGEWYSVSGHSN